MAEQTLLQIVQDECRRQGVEVPTGVVASTDQTILQMWGLLNEEVEEHANREYLFQQLQFSQTFVYASDPNYMAYDLSGLAGYTAILPDTFWNLTQRLPVVGPYTPADWQTMLAMGVSGAMQNYIIAGNDILVYPGTPSSVQTYGFRYRSKYAVYSAAGTLKESFTADDDYPALPSRILKAGLRWRWRAEKGQPYAEQKELYEGMLQNEAHLGPNPGTLKMDGPDPYSQVAAPGLLIAAGSWNL